MEQLRRVGKILSKSDSESSESLTGTVTVRLLVGKPEGGPGMLRLDRHGHGDWTSDSDQLEALLIYNMGLRRDG